LGNRVNCRMSQSERNRRVAFRWEQVMELTLIGKTGSGTDGHAPTADMADVSS